MADQDLPQRLDRIETAITALTTNVDVLRTEVRADIAELRTHTEAIELELLGVDERHAELLAAFRDVRDQFFVQGGILQRLEHRDRTADGETLALQQQIMRLERRVTALEKKSGDGAAP